MYNAASSDEHAENGKSPDKEDRSNGYGDEKPAAKPVKKATAASIFGAAKPVDTSNREREIEERLAKERAAVDTTHTGWFSLWLPPCGVM